MRHTKTGLQALSLPCQYMMVDCKSCNTDSSLTGIFCTRILGDLTVVFKLQSLVEKKPMKNRKHHERSAKTFVDLDRCSTAFASTFCWIGYDKEFS